MNQGISVCQALALHLSELGCTVKIALPPKDGTDVADWIAAEGTAGAGRKIAALLQTYQPPEVEQPTLPDTPESPPDDIQILPSDIRDNVHYRLLGLVDTNIAITLKKAGRILICTRKTVTSIDTLIAIAPETWWCGLFPEGGEITRKTARIIGDAIIREADGLGQVDQSLFWGRGATRLPDGRIAYHLGDRLLIDGRIYGLTEDNSMVWLSEPRIELGDEANDRQVSGLARAVMGYRWSTQDDGRRFLGWIVAAIVGGALEWRPHLLLTAPATQGKTWLLKNVLEKLMGSLMSSLSDATPAAVSKLTEHASLPIAIDEAEPSEEWVVELLKTLRAASSDFGSRIRVAQTGGVSFQQARFCALLAGTVAPALARADDSRLTPVSFGPPVEDWSAVRLAITTMMQHADTVRYRIIRRAEEIIASADRLTVEMQDLGMDSREAMASAALTAGWRFWGVDDKDVFAQPENNNNSDASDALLEILALRMRTDSAAEMSVLEMMGYAMHRQRLTDLLGVKVDGGGLMIAAKHRGLSGAMNRSRWGNADLRRLLLQLDGAEMTPHPQRFGSLRTRAVLIPYKTLAEIGVELHDDEPEQE